MNQQRSVVYGYRNEVINPTIHELIEEVIDEAICQDQPILKNRYGAPDYAESKHQYHLTTK